MDVTPLIPAGRQVIQRYHAGGFRITGQDYSGAVIVMPGAAFEWPLAAPDLSSGAFDSLMPYVDELDVVLLGTGAARMFVDAGVLHAVKDKGVMVDIMDTGAACRTYNVLMAEGRRIAAALLPV